MCERLIILLRAPHDCTQCAQALEVELLERFSAHESIARFCGAFKREEDALWSVSQELWIGLELCIFGSAGRYIQQSCLPRLPFSNDHICKTLSANLFPEYVVCALIVFMYMQTGPYIMHIR